MVRNRWVGWVAAAGAAAVLAAGCGSTGSKTSSSAAPGGSPVGHAGDAAVLSSAYTKAVAAKSAKMTLHVDISHGTKQVTLAGSGAFDWGRRLGQLSFQVPLNGQTTTLTELLDGDSVYIQLPPQAAAQTGKPWARVDISGLAQSGATSDPAQTLAVLEGSSARVTDLGSQSIGGVVTTHYQAQVDPTKVAAPPRPPPGRLSASSPP